MTDPLTFVVTLALRVAALIFLFRFILQAARASFYNPFCEGIVRITDPVLNPLRQVLRPYRNLDFASFATAWVAHMAAAAIFAVSVGAPLNVLYILNDSLHSTLSLVVWIFLIAIFLSIVMSWIAPNVYSPAANVAREVAEPLLSPARRILPPLGGLDLSPMITVAVLLVIESFVLGTLLPIRVWAG